MSSVASEKPHVACIPLPAQGHVTPMLALAKLLHASGFHITFVNTESIHCRHLRSLATIVLRSCISPAGLTRISDFQFVTIVDGMQSCNEDAIDNVITSTFFLLDNGLPYLKDLLDKLNGSCSDIPKVTCVVADSIMYFALDAAKEVDIPCVLLGTSSPCSFMGSLHIRNLISRGLVPLKDLNQLSDNTMVESVTGMTNMRLRDFPSFIRTTDINDRMLNHSMHATECQSRASTIVMNTFHELDNVVLDAVKSIITAPIYDVGPLSVMVDQIVMGSQLKSLNLNLWKEEHDCFKWLKDKKPRSVLYVNFGSLAVMTQKQLVELAWGLANSKYAFLFILRPDLVHDNGTSMLPQEFLDEIKERGFIASWCPQMEVLRHEAIGPFLTHNGWNSTLESISNGFPMLSWTWAADQPTNCRYICSEWKIGMEIDNDMKRDKIEKLIREMMEVEEGKRMKERAMQWKQGAIMATQHDGSSFLDFQKLLHEVLLKEINK